MPGRGEASFLTKDIADLPLRTRAINEHTLIPMQDRVAPEYKGKGARPAIGAVPLSMLLAWMASEVENGLGDLDAMSGILGLDKGGTAADLSGGAIDSELIRMNAAGTALEGSGITVADVVTVGSLGLNDLNDVSGVTVPITGSTGTGGLLVESDGPTILNTLGLSAAVIPIASLTETGTGTSMLLTHTSSGSQISTNAPLLTFSMAGGTVLVKLDNNKLYTTTTTALGSSSNYWGSAYLGTTTVSGNVLPQNDIGGNVGSTTKRFSQVIGAILASLYNATTALFFQQYATYGQVSTTEDELRIVLDSNGGAGVRTLHLDKTNAAIYFDSYFDLGRDPDAFGTPFANLFLAGDAQIDGSVLVDTIDERTAAAGVTIDGLLLKDGLCDGRDVSVDGGVLDAHVGDASIHFTVASIDHGTITGLGDDDHSIYHTDARALTWLGTRSTTDLAEGTNLYWTASRFTSAFAAEDLAHLTGRSHTSLTDIGTNTHGQIDTHLASTSNPHAVTAAQITGAAILTELLGVDGTGSGLDADKLDGSEASAFSLVGHTHVEADITDLGAYLENVVEDASPQLGDDLDCLGNAIYGNSASGGSLLLRSTSHATKGEIHVGETYGVHVVAEDSSANFKCFHGYQTDPITNVPWRLLCTAESAQAQFGGYTATNGTNDATFGTLFLGLKQRSSFANRGTASGDCSDGDVLFTLAAFGHDAIGGSHGFLQAGAKLIFSKDGTAGTLGSAADMELQTLDTSSLTAKFRIANDGHMELINGGSRNGSWAMLDEISAAPSSPSADAQGQIFFKNGYIVFCWNDSGTTRYKYMDMTGTGVTWVHNTTAP